MKKYSIFQVLGSLFFISLAILSGCTKSTDNGTMVYHFEPAADNQAKVQEALINMPDGSTIRFSSGTFNFTSTLSLTGKDNIVIEGAAKNTTILSFAGQTAGAEGIKITDVKWFLIQKLTVKDTKGDAIKLKDSDGVSMIDVGTVWTQDGSADNGAYGLYPVQCVNILIDNCYVKGASDAGIYVGQSQKAIVRNSLVEGNVAGIEIENTISADVYGNTAQGNVGGILVFDLPNLPVYGAKTRVYNNTIIQNDHKNFAPAGNIVANVPPGTGIMVMSTKEVEIFNNIITNNNVMGVGIVSYLVLQNFDNTLVITDSLYNPYPSKVNIHGNTFSRNNQYPNSADLNFIGLVLTGLYAPADMPDILFDGILNSSASDVLCIRNIGAGRFANIDAEHLLDPNNRNPSSDLTPHDCTNDALPAVTVNAPGL